MNPRTLAVTAAAVAIFSVIAIVAFAGNDRPAGTSANPASFVLPRLDGSGRVSLATFRGRPVVLTLFASWCAECRRELPAFAAEAHALSGRVEFIGVDSEETGDGRAMATQYGLAAAGFSLARDVGPGGSALHDALRAPGMPVTVFYDAGGRVLTQAVVSLSPDALRAELRRLYGA